MKKWMVFNIGCIECGVSSNIVGIYPTKEQADIIASKLNEKGEWRRRGQNYYEVYSLSEDFFENEEYTEILKNE